MWLGRRPATTRIHCGFTLIEVLAACFLLAALVSVSLQFFRAAGLQRRGMFERQTAIEEASNVMERLWARPWEALPPGAVADVRLSPQATRLLPHGRVEARIDPPAGTPPAKRIRLAVCWQPVESQPAQTIELVAWKARTP
ncbi:MAG: prepilin-type N-terminal cleavage/methylation domain-containing protein [Thermoguttaceae bacterium]|jgi:prepilin-type N-terminal cleavage/methylation domain-containing protein